MKADVPPARLCASFPLFAALLLVLIPMRAAADVYKWADERGTTVISNIPPADSARVTNLEVVLKETKRAGQKSETTPTEQMLLDRVESLERQLAQQYARERMAPPPNVVSYSNPPLPPPAYPAPYYPAYYPPYYPNYYSPYAFPFFYPSVSTIVFPSRSGFRHHGFHHGRSMHRGRR